MSAFIVDREHVLYLVEAARAVMGKPPYPPVEHTFRWTWKKDPKTWYHRELRRDATPFEVREVAQMLWDACIHAVKCRYPNEKTLPGPMDEDYVITLEDCEAWHWREPFDPVQVLKACACYEYQASEDADWESTEAYAFIQMLRRRAIRALPGYESKEWGSPKPDVPVRKERRHVMSQWN